MKHVQATCYATAESLVSIHLNCLSADAMTHHTTLDLLVASCLLLAADLLNLATWEGCPGGVRCP